MGPRGKYPKQEKRRGGMSRKAICCPRQRNKAGEVLIYW